MDEQYRNAIGSVESSNNYAAVGPETDDGDRAYGRYQVMGNNIPEWTNKHLGKSMTPDEFLKDKDAQDKVFDGETSEQYKKYGNLDDVTSKWFSGRPIAQAGNASDGYNTTPQYIAKVNAAYNGNPMQTAMRGKNAMANTDDTKGSLSLMPDDGALSKNGSAPASGNWLDTIGQTLMNVAPGLASISDPDRAKALAAIAAASQKTAVDGGTWSTSAVDPKTGVAVQTNSKTAATRRIQVHAPQPEKPEKDPVQQAADIARVKSFQDYGDTIAKNGADSRAALDTVGPIQAALSNPNVPQGTMGETRHTANKALLNVPGMDTPELRKTVADTDVAVSGINKMVQEGRTLNGGMPGSLSDKDIVFLKQSQAGLGNTPEANQRIMDIYKQLHQRRIELDNARQSYVDDAAAHPLGLDNGFKKMVNDKWAAENAARDKALAATEAAAPVVAVQSFKAPSGIDVKWKRN